MQVHDTQLITFVCSKSLLDLNRKQRYRNDNSSFHKTSIRLKLADKVESMDLCFQIGLKLLTFLSRPFSGCFWIRLSKAAVIMLSFLIRVCVCFCV